MEWNEKEMVVINRFFKSNINELTLYKQIFGINPKRTLKAVTSKLERLRKEGYEKKGANALKKLRIGYLDIEATQLAADFGYIISWSIKDKGKNYYDSAVITKKEIFNLEFDKRVVRELLEAMSRYDILYTHYGSDWRFDVPFIRTRAYKHNLEKLIPKNMELFIRDTYPIAKAKLKLHSNRLGSIAEALGIKDVKKTPIDSDKWIRAAVGDIASLKYVAIHNKRDVQLLERVHNKLSVIERPKLTTI